MLKRILSRKLTRHILSTVLLVSFIFMCIPVSLAADSSEEIKTTINQTTLGSIFYEGDTVTFNIITQGQSISWRVMDVWDKNVLSGTALVGNGNVDINLSSLGAGYYVLLVNTINNGVSISEIMNSFAIVTQYDFGAVADERFALQAHLGSFPNGKPTWDTVSKSYTDSGVPTYDPEIIQFARIAGANQIRDELPWNIVEPEEGIYALPQHHIDYMNEIYQHGMKSLQLLNYGNKVYDVDDAGIGAVPYTDRGQQAYANYGKALVDIINAGDRDQIVDVEVWNEYNAAEASWNRGPAKADPANYYLMLKKVYETIKPDNQTNQNVRITGPAAVTIPYGWLESLFQTGALQYMDAVTIHPYTSTPSLGPEKGYGAPSLVGSSIEDRISQLETLIKQYNNGQTKPIYYTEVGYGSQVGGIGISERAQAQNVVRMHAMSFAAGVDKINWYSLINTKVLPEGPGANWGLLRHTTDPMGKYAPKPSFVSYSVMTRQLYGANFTGKDDTTADNLYSYIFNKNDNDVRIVWSPDATIDVSIETTNPLTLTDMMGGQSILSPIDGKIYLTASQDPVYLSGHVDSFKALTVVEDTYIKFTQTKLGNVFDDNETIKFDIDTNGRSVNWDVKDIWGNIVIQGTTPVLNRKASLNLPINQSGYYVLSVNSQYPGKAEATAKNSFAVLSPYEQMVQRDNRFGFATTYGQFKSNPVWNATTNVYGNQGTPMDNPESISLIAATGAGQVRDFMGWNFLEPEKGVYGLPLHFDTYMQKLNLFGIKAMISTGYGNKLYDKDASGIGAIPYTDTGRQGYANYAGELCRRFGQQLIDVEVWNQYNLDILRNRGPGRLDPQNYYELIKDTYNTLKSEYPDVNISGPSAFGLPFEWLEEVFKTGALDNMDAVVVQPYGSYLEPESGYEEGLGLDDRLEQLQDLIKQYNNGNSKPVYLSEIGWGTHTGGLTEREQAQYIVRSFILSFASGAEKVFWRSFIDSAADINNADGNFGLIRNANDQMGQYAPKPSYVAYGVMTRKIGGFNSVDKDDTDQAIRSYAFKKNDVATRVIWTTGDDIDVVVNTQKSVIVTDIMGKEITLVPDNDKVIITLSQDPLYVKGNIISIDKAKVTTVEITGTDTVVIPLTDSITTNYTGDVKDQFSKIMDEETVTWSIVEGSLNGVSIAGNGTLVVESNALPGTISLQATSNTNPEIKATKTIQLLKGYTAIEPVSVSTVVGSAPVLPTVVMAVYNDITRVEQAVVWDSIDPSQYAKKGSFTVAGTVASTPILAIATVTVTEEPQVSVITAINPIIVNTLAGKAPILPTVVMAVYSDSTSSVSVLWEAINPTKYASAGSFTVQGYVYGTAIPAIASITVREAPVTDDDVETTPTPTPVIVNESTVIIEANIDVNGTVEVDVKVDDLKKAVDNVKDAIIGIEVKAPVDAKEFKLSIPAQYLASFENKQIEGVEINTGLATVTINPKLLKNINVSNSSNLQITISKVDKTTLTEEIRQQLGSNEVYDFELNVDGNKISKFNRNEISVAINYTLKPGEDPNKVVLYFIDDIGKFEIVKNGKYNTITGKVEFKPGHFSKYAAAYVDVTFNDLINVAWAKNSIEALAARDVIDGVGYNSFKPDDKITRAEFLKILMKALDLADDNAKCAFSDVKEGEWYYNSITAAHKLGIIQGKGDGIFGANDEITRQDMAVMTYRAVMLLKTDLANQPENSAEFIDKAEITEYAVEEVAYMQKTGIILGDKGRFMPRDNATRAEAAVIIYRLFGL